MENCMANSAQDPDTPVESDTTNSPIHLSELHKITTTKSKHDSVMTHESKTKTLPHNFDVLVETAVFLKKVSEHIAANYINEHASRQGYHGDCYTFNFSHRGKPQQPGELCVMKDAIDDLLGMISTMDHDIVALEKQGMDEIECMNLQVNLDLGRQRLLDTMYPPEI